MRKSLLVFASLCFGVGSNVQADEGDWMVRARALFVSPSASSSPSGLDAENNFTAEVDITRFFTPNIAAELILGTTPHEVKLNGSSIGSAGLLPPTLTVQYHFSPGASIRPYAGIGVNYTNFYSKSGDTLDTLDLDDSFGYAVQVGADWMLTDRASFNLDLKYVNIETEVSSGGVKQFDFKINPTLLGVGFGYRF